MNNQLPKKDKKTIVAKNKEDLERIVAIAMENDGDNCDLNYIDTSNITDMSHLFSLSKFNGDISSWNTSNVTDMNCMFKESMFKQNIDEWPVKNILKVTDMDRMFLDCLAKQSWWYIQNNALRSEAIENYLNKQDLMHKLNEKLIPSKPIKKLKI